MQNSKISTQDTLAVLYLYSIISKEDNDMDKVNEVTDMYLVAALFAYGAEYIGVSREDKKNQRFMFRDPLGVERIFSKKHGVVEELDEPSFDEFKQAFDTVTLMYPPQYVEALRRVKGIIHT
jgi:hypothetical protein